MVDKLKQSGIMVGGVVLAIVLFVAMVWVYNYGDHLMNDIGEKVPWLGKFFGWQKGWQDKVS